MTDEQVKEALFQSWKRKRAQQMKESTNAVERTGLELELMAARVQTASDTMKGLRRALWQCQPRKRFVKKRVRIKQQKYLAM